MIYMKKSVAKNLNVSTDLLFVSFKPVQYLKINVTINGLLRYATNNDLLSVIFYLIRELISLILCYEQSILGTFYI